MPTIWSSLQYGWQHIYWVQVEGIPVCFMEKATALTLPASHPTQDTALIIDDSSAIGSEVSPLGGIGKSLPLTFRLQDTSTVRSYLQRWSAQTRITQDHSSNVGTITVADTTDFANSGTVYIGEEAITYTGKTATTFTGTPNVTRGVAGYAYAYKDGGPSGFVTDKPRWWRGREVKLWAAPIDPTGHEPGSSIEDNSVLIWRGHINSGPRREGLHFVFDALALDRRLARPIGRRFSGILTDAEVRYPIYVGTMWQIRVGIQDNAMAWTYHDLEVRPFASNYSDGDMITGDMARAAIVTAYEAAVSAAGAGADLESIRWVKKGFTGVDDLAMSQVIYVAHVTFDADANARGYSLQVLDGAHNTVAPPYIGSVGSFSAGQGLPTFWATTDNPLHLTMHGAIPLQRGASIMLLDGDPADAPSSGVLRVGEETFYYNTSENAQGLLYLGEITKIDATGYGSLKAGVECAVLAADGTQNAPTTLPVAALRMMHSSGEAALREATYDTLGEGQGYGLSSDQVDVTEVAKILGSGLLGVLGVQTAPDDESLEDLLGGLLQLSGRALVMRPDSTGKAVITAVEVGAAADYEVTIGDADLLTIGHEPVVMERVEDWPNRVEVEAKTAGETTLRLVYSDRPAIVAQGARGMEVTVPAVKPGELQGYAWSWAMSILQGAQALQLMRIWVNPWVNVEVGDGVQVQITHPAIWDWSTGKPGYTGAARCIGRHTTLKNGATELLLLVGGGTPRGVLCPSAAVLATDDTANPTQIDVDRKYYSHFTNAISAAGGNIRVLHYRPGQTEGTSEGYNIAATEDTGSVCRLTVDSKIGTPTLTANNPAETDSSHITLPESANDDAYQARFMHDADGSVWN